MVTTNMGISGTDLNLVMYSRDMVFRAMSSPTFRNAIEKAAHNSESFQKSKDAITDAEWDEFEDAVRDIFLEVAPTVRIARIPPDLEEAYNADPLPRIVGADGVFAIFDPAGFGLGETWFAEHDEAISAAASNWTDLDWS